MTSAQVDVFGTTASLSNVSKILAPNVNLTYADQTVPMKTSVLLVLILSVSHLQRELQEVVFKSALCARHASVMQRMIGRSGPQLPLAHSSRKNHRALS